LAEPSRAVTTMSTSEAAKYRIKGWTKISDAKKIEDVKAQLALGVPVIFDMRVREQFQQFKGNGVLDIPGVMSGGGHTMLAIGYDDSRKAFRIQNSWGRKYGEGGYAWLSYDFRARNVGLGYVID
jgi:C1A family cysteine protease